ncbi:hypothetical protein PUNSTDRAFT_130772 [Punctularia strigosozonata HHB-11173 SS5]|uniref:uncharacterized protein n=1 Tax=Punctularia strigosozonata (strain HHB-11173) TaxID=741275 RepID=UPI00044168AB|nr:uncharacterized protein PUNSTDRAFT_130772 [Punctularia strigosozonata HHB-11173 SS5]EIN12513.1 hypothetical protein PUNSTDRAFT_130772 [Punctularia strigosozonata HHB-11173 SS5]
MDHTQYSFKIPQEIWEHVIELVDDESALKTFLTASPHLRAHITILSVKLSHLGQLAELGLPNVRDLRLSGRSGLWGLGSLDRVHIGGVDRWAALTAFPRLRNLHIHDDSLTALEFIGLLRPLPPISCIGLHSISWLDDGATEPLARSSGPPVGLRLTELRIEEGDGLDTLEHFMSLTFTGDVILALEKLSLDVVPTQAWITATNALMQRNNIHSLWFGRFQNISRHTSFLDFSGLHALHDLTVELSLPINYTPDLLRNLSSSVATINSLTLNPFVIVLRLMNRMLINDGLIDEIFGEIGAALAKPPFRRLTELRIQFPDPKTSFILPGPRPNASRSIDRHFGAIKEQGVAVKLFTGNSPDVSRASSIIG